LVESMTRDVACVEERGNKRFVLPTFFVILQDESMKEKSFVNVHIRCLCLFARTILKVVALVGVLNIQTIVLIAITIVLDE
jgi:hypothetical protein